MTEVQEMGRRVNQGLEMRELKSFIYLSNKLIDC